MKLNQLKGTTDVEGRYILDGMTMTGPLILNVDGINENEAVSKDYVDQLSVDVEASNVTRGTMSFDRFPGFTGDLTKEPGSQYINLVDSGVVPGTYTKITVSNKGIVLNGSNLDYSDIPDLGWEKIINRPSTLLGYGIVDGVNKNNGVVNGHLTSPTHPTGDSDAVTMGYLDSLTLLDSGTISTGDVVNYAGENTPSGYLKLDGSSVPISEYLELYSIIGDRYSNRLSKVSGVPWARQHYIKKGNYGTDFDFQITTTGRRLPSNSGVNSPKILYLKNYIYLLGGSAGTPVSYASTVSKAGSYMNGSWSSVSGLLPVNRISSSFPVVVIKNYVYILGGRNTISSSIRATNVILRSEVNSNGSLGDFEYYGTLPSALIYHEAVVIRDKLVLMGSGTDIYMADISVDGELSNWRLADSEYPVTSNSSKIFVTRTSLYMLSGLADDRNLYALPINNDGDFGTWITLPSMLPQGGIVAPSIVTTGDKVYCMSAGSGNQTLYLSDINEMGVPGVFYESSTTLPTTDYKSELSVIEDILCYYDRGTKSLVFSRLDEGDGFPNGYMGYTDNLDGLTDRDKFNIPEMSLSSLVDKYIKY